jgi:hypothetical protein
MGRPEGENGKTYPPNDRGGTYQLANLKLMGSQISEKQTESGLLKSEIPSI